MIKVNSYDIDGVIYMGEYHDGLRPGPEDIIVTGRSFEEKDQTLNMLRGRGIYNMVFFNPIPRKVSEYSTYSSGKHKANVFNKLFDLEIRVDIHFEDDYVQGKAIEEYAKFVKVIMVGEGEWVE